MALLQPDRMQMTWMMTSSRFAVPTCEGSISSAENLVCFVWHVLVFAVIGEAIMAHDDHDALAGNAFEVTRASAAVQADDMRCIGRM
jgi:hypothetical protein